MWFGLVLEDGTVKILGHAGAPGFIQVTLKGKGVDKSLIPPCEVV